MTNEGQAESPLLLQFLEEKSEQVALCASDMPISMPVVYSPGRYLSAGTQEKIVNCHYKVETLRIRQIQKAFGIYRIKLAILTIQEATQIP